ncbi:MAG TPA: BsuPI-related putative proteinase inhibitor [Gemmatimonadales bacterium]
MSLWTLVALLLHGAMPGGAAAMAAPPSQGQADSMRVEIVAPATVRKGRPVRLALKVSNTTDRPITLYLQGRPVAFDLVVRQRAGGVVWQRLEGATVSAILGVRTLDPGATLELTDTWNQRTNAGKPAEPGDYVVTGSVLTDREPLEAIGVPLTITR